MAPRPVIATMTIAAAVEDCAARPETSRKPIEPTIGVPPKSCIVSVRFEPQRLIPAATTSDPMIAATLCRKMLWIAHANESPANVR